MQFCANDNISTRTGAGLYKLIANGSSLFSRYRGYGKLTKAYSNAVDTTINAAYDSFLADANNKISDITGFESKVQFIEKETGLQILIHFKATNEKGDNMKSLSEINIPKDKLNQTQDSNEKQKENK